MQNKLKLIGYVAVYRFGVGRLRSIYYVLGGALNDIGKLKGSVGVKFIHDF